MEYPSSQQCSRRLFCYSWPLRAATDSKILPLFPQFLVKAQYLHRVTHVAMSSASPGEEVVFTCSDGVGDRSVKISAWAPGKGAVQRTYSCEAQGGGAALALLGKTYLLCALKSLPFLYVWHLRKVSNPVCTVDSPCMPCDTTGAGIHEDGLLGSDAVRDHHA